MSWFDDAYRYIRANAGRVARRVAGAAFTLMEPALYALSRLAGQDNDPILTAAIRNQDMRLIGIRVASWVAAGVIEYATVAATGATFAAVTALTSLTGPLAPFIGGAAAAGVFTVGTAASLAALSAGNILMRESFKQRYPEDYQRMLDSGQLQRDEGDQASLGRPTPTSVAALDAQGARTYPSIVTEVTGGNRPVQRVFAHVAVSPTQVSIVEPVTGRGDRRITPTNHALS